MSAAVLEQPRAAGEAARVGGGGRVTLEDVLSSAWEGLAAHRTVACPVCAGELRPRYGAAGLAPVGGRCADCASVLG
jgi:hypothetical protein